MNEKNKYSMAEIRRQYGELALSKKEMAACPFVQLKKWFDDIVATDNYDPTAMLLSTVDENGAPDARVVLLKGIVDEHLVFYTNYNSTKAKQLEKNAHVHVNFFWPTLSRQVRIKGLTSKAPKEMSDYYFSSRPQNSQISAIASAQSEVIKNREHLESAFNILVDKYGQAPIIRSDNWGGYLIKPIQFEFWQGRDDRLHDRIRYRFCQNGWQRERLAP